MAQDDEWLSRFLLGAVVCAAGLAMLGVALLIAIVRSGPQLYAPWLVIVFQVLLSVVAVAAAGVCIWLLSKAISGCVDRLAALEQDHADLLQRLKQRTPAFLAVALISSQAALLLADKTFDGEPMPTLLVSFFLLIGFWVSNELQTSKRRGVLAVGWGLWFLVLLYLPVAVMLFRGWSLRQVAAYVWGLELATQASWGLAILVLVAAPLLMLSRGDKA